MRKLFNTYLSQGNKGLIKLLTIGLAFYSFEIIILLSLGVNYYTIISLIRFILFFIVAQFVFKYGEELLLDDILKKRKLTNNKINIIDFSITVSKNIIILYILNTFLRDIYISPISIVIIPIILYFIFYLIKKLV